MQAEIGEKRDALGNAEAAQPARTLAHQTGKTIADRPRREPVPQKRVALWRRLLLSDRKGMVRPETPVEALYDEITGLPT
jgi:hypothetical protein